MKRQQHVLSALPLQIVLLAKRVWPSGVLKTKQVVAAQPIAQATRIARSTARFATRLRWNALHAASILSVVLVMSAARESASTRARAAAIQAVAMAAAVAAAILSWR